MSSKLKIFAFQKTLKKMKRKATDWDKILQNIYLSKGFYLENIKNPYEDQ